MWEIRQGEPRSQSSRQISYTLSYVSTEAILLKDFPINLSALTNPVCMELTPKRSRQAHNWKGQEQHWELRGNVYFKQ
jgi:hypothetical protein